MPECSACGWVGPYEGKFCLQCGAPLSGARAEPRPARKIVTVLFSDLGVSDGRRVSALGGELDAEKLQALMRSQRAAVTAVIARHGGRVERFMETKLLAVFGLPAAGEDDALRAVRAAVEIEQEIGRIADALRDGAELGLAATSGINTGEIYVDAATIANPESGQLIGDAVNVAARLEAAASPGEILLGEPTHRLASRHLDGEWLELELKGKSQAVPTFRLTSISEPGASLGRRLLARTIGRETEAAQLAAAFDTATSSGECRLVTILGLAGAGKSRLVRDWLEAVAGRARVLSGRCLPYGEATIFWPLAEIACQAAGIKHDEDPAVARAAFARLLAPEPDATDHAVAARLAGAFGLGPLAGPPEETPRDVATLFKALASSGPLVAVIEDIHWGRPALLSTLEYLAADGIGAPVLLVCPARPELLESRPDWPCDAPRAETVEIAPLGDEDCGVLVAELLGEGDASRALAARVVASAGGNPLLVEEILAMLIDEGMLARVDGVWSLRKEPDEIRIPPTINAIVAARIDRLSAREREVLEAAAVIGGQFEGAEVSALCDGNADERTDMLVEKQFFASGLAASSDYRFHHILVRDAAYAITPKRRRADLHERYADLLEGTTSEVRGGVYGEIVGEHLERSCLLRRELGAGDEEVGELAHRAAEALMEAGRRAIGLSDFPASLRACTRAEAVLARDDALRPLVLTELAGAKGHNGLQDEALGMAREALELAERLEAHDVRPLAALTAIGAGVFCGARQIDEALVELREIAAELERIGDDRSIVSGWTALSAIGVVGGRFEDSWKAAARAAERVRAYGGPELAYCLVGVCLYISRSPTPIAEAYRRCEEALAPLQPGTMHASMIEWCKAFLEGMSGAFEVAHRRFTDATEVFARYGDDLYTSVCLIDWTLTDLLAGDLVAAEERAARACKHAAALDPLYVAGPEAIRARVLARLGRYADAQAEAQAASEHMSANDIETHVWWRIADALALTGLGDLDAAEARARDGLTFARRTDSPLLIGDALACLGEALFARGRAAEGHRAVEEAIGLYEGKGIAPAVTAARELLRRAREATPTSAR